LPASDQAGALRGLSERLAEAMRDAGALALKTCATPPRRWNKEDGSPVTDGDIAVDRLLHERLADAVPDCAWFSEENHDDAVRTAARRQWIIDPIDGTRAYMTGRPDWSIAAALVEDGRPILAAVCAPAEQALFLAIAGQGATRNGIPIRATTGTTLEGTRATGPKPLIERIGAIVPGLVAVDRVYSLALRLARVAEGAVDAAFAGDFSHDWDLAAADLLVHEAGGALTMLDGRALTYNRAVPVHGALVAAGGGRHARLVELLRTRHDALA
jgi:myo-inositol-1(or 4)-monophosphatase